MITSSLTRQTASGGKKQLYGAKKRIGIYAGQYYDQETGLHYNYHRYYDPKLGRYLRADPLTLSSIKTDNFLIGNSLQLYLSVAAGYKQTSTKYDSREEQRKDEYFFNAYKNKIFREHLYLPIKQNRYAYANNNPIAYYDQLGLSSCSSAVKNAVWTCTLAAASCALVESGIGGVICVLEIATCEVMIHNAMEECECKGQIYP